MCPLTLLRAHSSTGPLCQQPLLLSASSNVTSHREAFLTLCLSRFPSLVIFISLLQIYSQHWSHILWMYHTDSHARWLMIQVLPVGSVSRKLEGQGRGRDWALVSSTSSPFWTEFSLGCLPPIAEVLPDNTFSMAPALAGLWHHHFLSLALDRAFCSYQSLGASASLVPSSVPVSL